MGIALVATKRRTSSGQYSRADKAKEYAPTQVKRLRDAAIMGMADPEWGTELGRMFLQHSITPEMYAAGKRWSEMAASYQHAIGVFPIRSISLERGIRSAQPDPDSDKGQEVSRREINAQERFFEAHSILISEGCLAEAVVRRLCEHNEIPVGTSELLKLRVALLALARYWNLTNDRK